MLTDLLDLALPATCALCHAPARRLCRSCRRAVAHAVLPRPAPRAPHPAPPGMPRCWVTGEASGALRALVTAYKDEGRRDLRPVLAALLAPALGAAAAEASHAGGVLVVPVPGSPASRRRRGDVPLHPVVRAAVSRLPHRLVVADVLSPTRATRDQSRLDAHSRARNLSGAMEVRAPHRVALPGASCLVVDDLMTTGATLAEAARALRAAGAECVVASVIGATRRRHAESLTL